MTTLHQPVLLQETLHYLNVQPGAWYIDATLGSAGHTLEILKQGGNVLGLDQDPKAIERAKNNLDTLFRETSSSPSPNRRRSPSPINNLKSGIRSPLLIGEGQGEVVLTTTNFSHLKTAAKQHNLNQVAGILFDLGVSSDQLADPHYGLSFQTDSPLDMRLDPTLGVTAADLLNSLPTSHLEQLFREFGDEPRAKFIAKQIVTHRPLRTTRQLADLIVGAHPSVRPTTIETLDSNVSTQAQTHKSVPTKKYRSIHPATRIFQALRIAVNNEFENLESGLNQTVDLLKPGGRLVVISFHSGEDRIVKQFLKDNSLSLQERVRVRSSLKTLTPKPITPSQSEIQTNPRARSAKLRVGEKIS